MLIPNMLLVLIGYRTSSNKNRSNTSQKPTKNYPNNNVIAPFSRGQPSEAYPLVSF